MTHERDILKKDCKRISLERDGAYKHLSLTTAVAAHAASQVTHSAKAASNQQPGGSQNKGPTSASIPPTSPTTMDTAASHQESSVSHGNHTGGHKDRHQLIALAPHHHHRTASDTGTSAPSPSSMASSVMGKTGKTYNIFLFNLLGNKIPEIIIIEKL